MKRVEAFHHNVLYTRRKSLVVNELHPELLVRQRAMKFTKPNQVVSFELGYERIDDLLAGNHCTLSVRWRCCCKDWHSGQDRDHHDDVSATSP